MRPDQPTSPSAVADRDFLEHRLMPAMRKLIDVGYFKFEVEGIEHVPADGPVVFAQNHAGWFALDAFFVGLAVVEKHGIHRAPCFATAEAALKVPVVGPFLRRIGGVPSAWFRRPERLPPEIECCGIFPEGVRGNCKPFWHAYRMVDWNRGFVRVALAKRAPIVPVAVLGGEECLPVAWTVRRLEPLIGSIIGLPLAPLPLPTKWKVVFHPPVDAGVLGEGAMNDHARCTTFAREIQKTVQATLDRESPGYPLGKLARAVADAKRRRGAPRDEDPLEVAPRPDGGDVPA